MSESAKVLANVLANVLNDEGAEETRFENLCEVIGELYGSRALEDVDEDERSYRESTIGIFEVTEITASGCVLEEINYDFEVSPVVFPKEVLEHMDEKDVFMITLGKRGGRWHVIYMSYPYESIEWNENEDIETLH